MDETDLLRYITEHGIKAKLVQLESETPTVDSAAQAVGVGTDQIGKSILFLADGEPLLIIANGTTRIGYKPLADYLGMSRRRVKLANATQVVQTTGYIVGTVPPFGHSKPLNTIVEEGVLFQQELYVGGGSIQALLRIAVDELLRVTDARILNLAG